MATGKAHAVYIKGSLHLSVLNALGQQTGQLLDINTTAVTLSPPDSSKISVTDQSVERYGQTITSITLPGGTPASISFSTNAIPKDQWDLWLSGTKENLIQSAGTAVAFEVTANLDKWVPLGGGHIELSALAVTAPAETAIGVDYEVDYQGGRIRALSSGLITQGATITGTYSHAAITSEGGLVHGGSILSRRCYIYLRGQNLATKEKVLLDVWDADLTFGEAQIVSDGFMSVTAQGTMVTPPDKTSPYDLRTWVAPAA
jgi:hypothetical protein